MPSPLLRFRLHPADRPVAEAGSRLIPGDALLERARDPFVTEIRRASSAEAVKPGELVRPPERQGSRGRRGAHFEGTGRALYQSPGRPLLAAVGRQHELIASPVHGTVERIDAGAIVVRAVGVGIPAIAAAGDPAVGRLVLAVSGPDAELRASTLDVGASGAILVAGGRVDVEALTRARAMGVRGVITGGLVGKDLRGYRSSEARQRAGLQPASAFGLLVLDGYGRRPIPGPIWECLVAAEGSQVGISVDPPMLVLEADSALPPIDPDRVRVTAGRHLGREGRFIAPLGPMRQAAGLYQQAVLVALDAVAGGQPAERVSIPAADLERFG